MNRLKELRQKNKLNQIELANKVHASNQAISAYENGTREPKLETWQKLANFFNVSVPYLQGTDDKTVIKKINSEDLLQELIDRKVLVPLDYQTFGLSPAIKLKPKGEKIVHMLEKKIQDMPVNEFNL